MNRAVLSDIHGNLEALEAVLADIESEGISEVYCLGDIVGYGPNPRECIDLVKEFDCCVVGNHDQGALFDPEGFSSGAERAVFWTRAELEQPLGNGEAAAQRVARWDFLGELPRRLERDNMLFVHGSARNPLNEYVFPEDVYNVRKIERLFEVIGQHCFQGHTHVPGVITQSGRFYSPSEIDYHFDLNSQKTMINVGSVGQPRDADRRACYVALRDQLVQFRRVEYPFEKTIEKINAVPELDKFLADRLREGR